MTLSRQPVRVLSLTALAAALYASSVRAQGAPTETVGPPVAPAAPMAAPVAVISPVAPAKTTPAQRPWLRSKAPQPVASAAPVASPWRLAALGAVVAGLGGAALFQRRRRTSLARAVRSDLTVMSAVRVGNKAQVVVVNVGGRKLLLGVTEAEVSRLAWLDGDLDAASAEAESDGAFAESSARGASNGTELFAAGMVPGEPRGSSAAAAQAQPPRRFRELLFNALGQDSQPAARASAGKAEFSAAEQIAGDTRDVVSRTSAARVASPAGAPEMVDIEGQARGLILRLQKRA